MPTNGAGHFGMHILRPSTASGASQTPWHGELGFTHFRQWDTFTNHKTVEPTVKGTYVTTQIDPVMAVAAANNAPVLYTLGSGPEWATGGTVPAGELNPNPYTDLNDLVDYVEWLLNRYPIIEALEMWNEPHDEKYYLGTAANLATLTETVSAAAKAIRPSIKIVTGAPNSRFGFTFFSDYLAALDPATIDAVGYHMYSYSLDPLWPEHVVQQNRLLKAVMRRWGYADKPFWNTEWGYHNFYLNGVVQDGDTELMTDAMGAAYMARMLLMGALCGWERSYYYQMDNDWCTIRLIDVDAKDTVLDAGTAYRYWAGFLAGATLSRFRQVPPLYSVDWSKNGASGRIYWCRDDATQNVDLSGFTSGVDVLGASITLSASYSVTHSPVIVTR